jgi:hypothetical protein
MDAQSLFQKENTMITDANKSEMSSEELAAVAGGGRNIDNPVVSTVIRAFEATVKEAQHEAVRANGPMGSTFPGHF